MSVESATATLRSRSRMSNNGLGASQLEADQFGPEIQLPVIGNAPIAAVAAVALLALLLIGGLGGGGDRIIVRQ